MQRMIQYRRRGLGLVELLVAMALVIGIMWILAEAFKTGLDMTRELRSTTAMVNQLDGAKAVLSHDLSRDHFLTDNRPGSGPRLSQQRLDWLTKTGAGWMPPRGGFFRIMSPAPTIPASDADGFSMNTATTCALHFTAILAPNDRNLYTAKLQNGATYSSRAAEIAYFLVDSGLKTSATGQTLYKLHRRIRLVAVSTDEISQLRSGLAAGADPNAELIAGQTNANPNLIQVYTLENMRFPRIGTYVYRLDISPATMPGGGQELNAPYFKPGTPYEGTDLLLSHVLSFEVQVDWSPNTGNPAVAGDELMPSNTFWPRGTGASPPNWDYPFDSLALAGNTGNNITYPTQTYGLFDTWGPLPDWNNFALGNNANALPLAVRVRALKITLRIWDQNTKQTRQTTIVQEM
jgi:hypothetical protein